MPGPEDRPSVLVVDDDPIFALINTKRFQKAGFVVFQESTLDGAIGTLLERRPTVVSTDGDLGSGGIADAVALAKVAKEHQVPVVLFSSHKVEPQVADLFSGAFTKQGGNPKAFVQRVAELAGLPPQH